MHSKQQQLEETLQRTVAMFAAASRLAAIGCGEWDVERDVLRVSEEWQDQWGLDRSELSMTDLEAIIHPEDRPAYREGLQEFLRQGHVGELEYRIVRPDTGKVRRIRFSGEIVRDQVGQPIRVFSATQDVTDNYRLAEALRASEEQYRTVADFTYCWEYWLTPEGYYLYVSPSCERITGYPPEAFTQDPDLVTGIIHPRDQPRAAVHLHNQLTASGQARMQFRILTRGGQVRWIDHQCKRVYSPEGEFLGVRGSNQDITEHKWVEAELRFKTDALENALNGFLIVNADAHLVYANRACLTMWGYGAPEEILGIRLSDCCADPLLSEHIIRMLRMRGQYTLEFTGRRKDGSTFDVLMAARSFLDDDGGELFSGTSIDITERKRSAEALEAEKARLRSVFQAAPFGIGIATDHTIQEASDILCEMTGYVRNELIGKSLRVLHQTEGEYQSAEIEKCKQIAERGTSAIDTRWMRKDGQLIQVSLRAAALSSDDLSKGVAFTALDTTERTRVEQELREREAEYRLLFEMANDGVILNELTSNHTLGHFLRVNQVACRMLGYTAEEMERLTPLDIQAPEDLGNMSTEVGRIQHGGSLLFEKILLAKGGRRFAAEIHSTLFEHRGKTVVLSLIRDVTERKEVEVQIRKLAFYDPLTRLPNRRLFMERLQQALSTCRRQGWHGAVLFIDLDNFKVLNDTRGHDVGDQLLAQVARRLSSRLRSDDTVARLGGDEFVVMLEHLSSHDNEAAGQAREVAKKILDSLNEPYVLDGEECKNSPSIGISLFHGAGETVGESLKRADIAMYRAKSAGRNTFCFFDPAIQLALESRAMMESELRRALRNRELELYFQAQIGNELEVIGVEALLRWRHPDRGLILPGDFIPLAEECGLIIPIGQWVLHTACNHLRSWAQDPLYGNRQLAVNISARQFRQAGFVEQVAQALEASGASPSRLRLELTVNLFLEDVDETIEKMAALKSLGIGFSIDNFGSGYTSLAHLKRLPLDQMKIDRALIRDVATDPDDATIVKAIVNMAKQFGLQVLAEGVENETQLAFLREISCDAYQGFLFGKPTSEAELPFDLSRTAARLNVDYPVRKC